MKTRQNKYSIRKFSVGASSILIAALLFMGGGSAQAAEQNQEQEILRRQQHNLLGMKMKIQMGNRRQRMTRLNQLKKLRLNSQMLKKIIAKMLMIIKQAYIMKIIKTLNNKIQKLKNKIQHKIQNKRSLLKNKVKRNKLLHKMQLKIQLSHQMNKWNLVRIHK